MGILNSISSLFSKKSDADQRGINNPSTPITTALRNMFTTYSAAGTVVNVENALGITEVWRAVKLLGENIASVPFYVVETMPDGTERIATEHPVARLIANPSPTCSSFSFMETFVVHAAFGNAYAILNTNARNVVTGLRLVDPKDVDIIEKGDGRIVYRVSGDNRTYDYDEVLHLQNTSWDGMAGLSINQIHRDTLGLAIAIRDYGARFYKNGAHLSGILKHPGSLSKEAMGRIRNSWGSQYEGADNAGRTAVLDEGMEYQKIGLGPQEAAFVETKKMVVSDIARIFGVPQFLLEDLERATFNNIEHLSQLFVNMTLRPWCKRIESEFNRKLFRQSEMARFTVRFDFDDLLMADLESRAEFAQKMFYTGAISPNDIRKMNKQNPIQGGDNHFVQSNMMELNKAAQMVPTNSAVNQQTDEEE